LSYCAHGAGGGVKADSWYLNNFQLVDSLLANGYAIFDVNGGSSVEIWAGAGLFNQPLKAYEYIRITIMFMMKYLSSVCLWAGCLQQILYINTVTSILAHGLFSAVLDLYGQAWGNPWYLQQDKQLQSFQFYRPIR